MLLRNAVEEAAVNPGAALDIVLAGPTPGRMGFVTPATFSDNAELLYGIRGMAGGSVKTEGGMGRVFAGPPTTLRRSTVEWNSDGTTSRLNFTGTCLVFCETPAERAVHLRQGKLLSASPAAIGGAVWGQGVSGNALAVTTLVPFEEGPKSGTVINVMALDAPTGPVTINVNGAGPVPLFTGERIRQAGAGDWGQYDMLALIFDGVNWRLMAPTQPSLLPVGAVLPLASHGLPPRFVWPDGRNLSRASYPKLHALCAANGYPFGAGNGSTTFGVPDLRGRTIFGKDNLGDVADAARIAGVLSSSAYLLGGTGGSQYLQSHAHGITDPGHAHGISDPGHTHSYQGSNADTNAPTPGGTSLFTERATKTTGSSGTGISVNGATTGIATVGQGGGSSQNLPPLMVLNWILFAGD